MSQENQRPEWQRNRENESRTHEDRESRNLSTSDRKQGSEESRYQSENQWNQDRRSPDQSREGMQMRERDNLEDESLQMDESGTRPDRYENRDAERPSEGMHLGGRDSENERYSHDADNRMEMGTMDRSSEHDTENRESNESYRAESRQNEGWNPDESQDEHHNL